MKLVGALGRDQTYVSAGGPVPGAGVGAGGNRVRFQEVPEDTAVGRVGVEAAGTAPKGKARRRGI